MFIREEFEEFEAGHLAVYAARSRESRGRVYPEEEHPYRTVFQRDRDRIIHTTAFRRLEYKTQVFVTFEGDYYRTRLTHTIEAAQIARTIARALRLNEDLAEAITLAHDIGHTPFGHAGEQVLAELMRDHGGFNHNTQTMRLVEKLERRYPEFPGLNLTWEMREGIIKHETEYDRSDASGYEPELRPTLEAQVVNVADEIAYNTHDLDDGLRSDMLRPQDLSGLALWEEARRVVSAPWSEMTRHHLIRHLINRQVTDVVDATARRLAQVQPQSLDDIRRYPTILVAHSDEMRAKNRQLKDFLMQNLYRHYRVMRMSSKAQRILRELFTAYVNEPSQLPDTARERLQEDPLPRVVCDYLAGMTDRYAVEEHQKLFDPSERV